jgi:hypothetical protein
MVLYKVLKKCGYIDDMMLTFVESEREAKTFSKPHGT